MQTERHFTQLLDLFEERRKALDEIAQRQDTAEELLASVEYELQLLVRHLDPVLPVAKRRGAPDAATDMPVASEPAPPAAAKAA